MTMTVLIFDINSDLEDDMRSSFPKNVSRASKLVVGDPQARDTTVMTASQKDSGEGEGTEGDYNGYNDYDKDIGGELGSLSSHKDIDDDAYVDIDINSDLEDDMHSSIPKNVSRASKLVVGDPQARDTTVMTASQKEATKFYGRRL